MFMELLGYGNTTWQKKKKKKQMSCELIILNYHQICVKKKHVYNEPAEQCPRLGEGYVLDLNIPTAIQCLQK